MKFQVEYLSYLLFAILIFLPFKINSKFTYNSGSNWIFNIPKVVKYKFDWDLFHKTDVNIINYILLTK